MKRIIKILMIILFTSILVVSFGCGKEKEDPKPQEKIVEGIKLDTTSVKALYDINEEFSSDGLKVYVVYNDKSEKEIMNYSLISDSFNNKKEGNYDILVKYSNNGNQFEEKFTVTVKSSVPTVQSIAVDITNMKTTYIIGEELSLEGLKVIATFSDNSEREVTDYTVATTGFKKDVVGYYRLLVTYTDGINECYASIDTYVKDVLSVVNYLIGIDVQLREKEFLVGTEYSTEDLVVLAVYKDGSTKDVTELVNVNSSQYNKDVVGCYEIIIDYSETYGSGVSETTIFWDSFYFAFVVENYGDSYEE